MYARERRRLEFVIVIAKGYERHLALPPGRYASLFSGTRRCRVHGWACVNGHCRACRSVARLKEELEPSEEYFRHLSCTGWVKVHSVQATGGICMGFGQRQVV